MVWYARILSPPKFALKPREAVPWKYSPSGYRTAGLLVTCPISLNTDLSDAYYPFAAILRVQVFELRANGWEYALSPAQDLGWKGANYGARVIKDVLEFTILTDHGKIINETNASAYHVEQIVLRVTAIAADSHESLGHGTPGPEPSAKDNNVPEFLDVWTAPYVIRYEKNDIHFELQDRNGLWLQRRLLFKGMWESKSEYREDEEGIGGDSDRRPVGLEDDENLKRSEPYHEHSLQPEMRLWEEEGETMARHVWDGGVALAMYFAQTVQSYKDSPLYHLFCRSLPSVGSTASAPTLYILELGAGVGTSGLTLAHLLSSYNTHVVLTDLPTAETVLQENIQTYMFETHVSPHIRATVERAVLDWALVSADPQDAMHHLTSGIGKLKEPTSNDAAEPEPEPEPKPAPAPKKTRSSTRARATTRKTPAKRIAKKPKRPAIARAPSPELFQGWDLVVVSDCTYNEDELHLLVATLVAVTGKRVEDNDGEGENEKREPMVVLARKPRHNSEEKFFGMMSEHGFEIIEQSKMRMPDRTKEWEGADEEHVDVILYR